MEGGGGVCSDRREGALTRIALRGRVVLEQRGQQHSSANSARAVRGFVWREGQSGRKVQSVLYDGEGSAVWFGL